MNAQSSHFGKQYYLTVKGGALVLALLSAGALGVAFIAQYGFDLAPCKLCIYQRWPYGLAIILCLASLPLQLNLQRICLMAVVLSLFTVSAVAVYHVGVEQTWWPGPSTCSASLEPGISVDELRKQLMATEPVRCDEIPWSLFGISIAGYNAIASFVMAVFGIGVLKRNWNLQE